MSFDPVKIRNMAEELMDKHLDLENERWSFHFSACKSFLGRCNPMDKTIEISTAFIQSMTDYQIKQVVLHEIAHAMVGTGMGHNFMWKMMASAIGVDNPSATMQFSKEQDADIFKRLKPAFVMVAPDGEIVKYWRRSPAKGTWQNIHKYFVRGKKATTKGKLKIMTFQEYQKSFA
jgi:hypothetical protein